MALGNLPPIKPLPLPDPLGLNKNGDAKPTLLATGTDAETAFNTLLQKIYDKIRSDGNAIIADMQKAQTIAASKLPDGTTADQPSADCLAAFIPVIQLIVNNQIVVEGVTPAPGTQPAATPDGLVTAFVKMRVVLNALTSPSVQKGCSWLQQTIQQAGTQGIANVLGGILGVTKLAGLGILPA